MGAQAAVAGERKGMATTALALGILSPLLACVGIGFFTAVAAVIVGSIAIVRVKQAPDVCGGKGSALAGTILGALTLLAAVIVAATGIVASIAIPSLLRGRVSANEAATIGDIRSVMSGEAAYQSANAGYYDTLECLGAPQSCTRLN